MDFDDYQAQAKRTLDMTGDLMVPEDFRPYLNQLRATPGGLSLLRRYIFSHMTLGLAGEAGEVADLVKKWGAHGAKLDAEKIMKELGDVLWYVAAVASLYGISLSDVASANIVKLKKRHPNGFSHASAQARADEEPTP